MSKRKVDSELRRPPPSPKKSLQQEEKPKDENEAEEEQKSESESEEAEEDDGEEAEEEDAAEAGDGDTPIFPDWWYDEQCRAEALVADTLQTLDVVDDVVTLITQYVYQQRVLFLGSNRTSRKLYVYDPVCGAMRMFELAKRHDGHTDRYLYPCVFGVDPARRRLHHFFHYRRCANDHFSLDLATGQWRSHASLLRHVDFIPERHAVLHWQGKLWLLGYTNAVASSGRKLALMCYDVSSDAWLPPGAEVPLTASSRLSLHTVLCALDTCGLFVVQDTRLHRYVFGGCGCDLAALAAGAGQWERRADRRSLSHKPAVLGVGDRIFALGGEEGVDHGGVLGTSDGS